MQLEVRGRGKGSLALRVKKPHGGEVVLQSIEIIEVGGVDDAASPQRGRRHDDSVREPSP